ncbi:MAG: lipid A deacylase LpxR family protein [Rhizobacter sp.]|nr:lipid A deacylase LpxR family protein [Ferruginibacter sp.]
MIKLFSRSIIFFTLLVTGNYTEAQLTDNTSTFRTLQQRSYFRFHYDNDYFTKTDQYYTQGITLEYVNPAIKKLLFSKLLWKPFAGQPQYGISLNLFGYTPTSIRSDSILYGNRPFNANISFKTFLIQADPVKKQQVSTAFSVGVMGPAALGYEIQYYIHDWTKNPLPHGWEFQTKNDLLLNYQINYEKQLLASGNHFLLNAAAEARLGTLNTKLVAGFNFMAGRFNKRYQASHDKKRKTEYYFYGQVRGSVIGYDASMQGGLFNRKSPYTIAAADVNRATIQADAGIILNFQKFYISYTQSFLSKEFNTGSTHRWGGISFGLGL